MRIEWCIYHASITFIYAFFFSFYFLFLFLFSFSFFFFSFLFILHVPATSERQRQRFRCIHILSGSIFSLPTLPKFDHSFPKGLEHGMKLSRRGNLRRLRVDEMEAGAILVLSRQAPPSRGRCQSCCLDHLRCQSLIMIAPLPSSTSAILLYPKHNA